MAVVLQVVGDYDGKQLARAQRDLNKLKRSAGGASGAFRDAGGGIDGVAAAMKSAGGRMTQVGKSMTVGMTIPLAALGAGLYKATDAAAQDAKGQAVLANALRNSAGASKDGVAAVEGWITAQGKALGVADDQLRPALATLAGATHDVAKAQALAGSAMDIAAAKGVPVNTAAKALSKAYAGNSTALARLLPGIDKAALKSGDLARMQQAVADVVGGAAADAADTEAGKREKANVALSESVETLGAAFIPLMSMAADLVTNNVVPAVTQLADWLGRMSPATRTAAVGFGVALAAAGPLVTVLGGLAKGVSGVLTGLKTVGGWSVSAGKGLLSFGARLGDAAAKSGQFAASIGSKVVSGLRTVGSAAADAAVTAGKAFMSFGTTLGNVAATAGQAVAGGLRAAGSAVASAGRSFLTAASSAGQMAAAALRSGAAWVVSTARMLAAKAAQLAVAAAAKVAAAGQWLLNAALTANPIGLVIAALVALGAGLFLAWKKSETFRNVVTSAWNGVKAAAQAVARWFTTTLLPGITAVWNGIKTGLSVLVRAVRAYVTVWLTVFRAAMNAIRTVATAVWNRVKSVVSGVLAAVRGIISRYVGLWLGAFNVIRGVVSKVSAAFRAARDKVVEWMGIIRGRISSLGGRLVSAFRSGIGGMSAVGRAIIDGIWSGISGGWGWLKDKIRSVASSLVDAAKRALGINSPSKVFAQIGEHVVEGFEQGIASQKGSLLSVVSLVPPQITAAASPASAAGTFSTGPVLPIPGPSRVGGPTSITIAPGAVQITMPSGSSSAPEDVAAAVEKALRRLLREVQAA